MLGSASDRTQTVLQTDHTNSPGLVPMGLYANMRHVKQRPGSRADVSWLRNTANLPTGQESFVTRKESTSSSLHPARDSRSVNAYCETVGESRSQQV